MALVLEPVHPFQLLTLVVLLAGVVIVGLAGWRTRWRALGHRRLTRVAALALSLAAVAALAGAAWNPLLIPAAQKDEPQLVVTIDVSDSVLRAEGGWVRVRAEAAAKVGAFIDSLPEEVRTTGKASVVTFREAAAAVREQLPLADLKDSLLGVERADFGGGDGTNLAAALDKAGELIAKRGGRGAVLLISDGHETTGDALAAAGRLARRGVSVHVLPLVSGSPEVAVTAANLPRQVNAGSTTYLRGVLLNGGVSPVDVELGVSLNGDLDSQSASGPLVQTLQAQQWARLRQPIVFTGLGLQFVDLALHSRGVEKGQTRRFFTHVSEPPRLLAVGGDNRWLSFLPAGAVKVRQVRPADLADAGLLRDTDAVVLSSVSAEEFPAGSLESLARVVQTTGTGLMVLNGGHAGASPETPTVLATYAGTPLADLLPVVPGPRPTQYEPPVRHVVIVIDASGSMSGWKLDKAKEVAAHIVNDLMRDRDRLDVLAFTTGVLHLVKEQATTAEGKRQAVEQINRLQSSGGTDPTLALKQIADLKLEQCGLFFMSDGGFNAVRTRPECKATAFAVGYESVPTNSPLHEFSDPVGVGPAFDPNRIKLPFFEPEERKKFFETGEFTPLPTGNPTRQSGQLPVPGFPLAGSAVTYAKEGADVVAVRPKLTDPVLAYGSAGKGFVGVFTGEIPQSWAQGDKGGQALEAWLRALLPYTERSRYDFNLLDRGDRLDIQVALVSKQGRLPQVDDLAATVELGDGTTIPVLLRPDPDVPGQFAGSLRLPRSLVSQRGFLVLRESGVEAVPRPQRIPLVISPAGEISGALPSEAYSWGTNAVLMRQIAETTGGAYEDLTSRAVLHAQPFGSRGIPLWPWLAVSAMAAYVVAVAVQRLEGM